MFKGTGKPCLIAALLFPSYFKTCIGIECLDGLLKISNEMKEVYEEKFRQALEKENKSSPELKFIKDDFVEKTNWAKEYDMIFINATCFEPIMLEKIEKAIFEESKKGSIVIINSKQFEDEKGLFEYYGPFNKEMSWGNSNTCWKIFAQQALMGSTAYSRKALPLLLRQSQTLTHQPKRLFASQELEVKKEGQNTEVDIESKRKKIGVDMQFSQQKHAYVLTFPWNFPEIIQDFEHDYRSISSSSFWHKFVFNNNAKFEFNDLFREFHQYCAIPDPIGINKVCEGRLADYVNQSIQRIRFHGLAIEMANLTVHQPRMRVLKAEISHGLHVDRSKNLSKNDYSVNKGSLFGAKMKTYIPKNDQRSFLDHLDQNYKPYCVAVTMLIESPMKLFVQNQNYSAVLFGSNDQETVKNVVRFEANFKWFDLFKLVPVENKAPQHWKITDFNNVLNENPYFENQ